MSDDLFTDDDVTEAVRHLDRFEADVFGLGFNRPRAEIVLAAVAPSIAARAVANLMDELMNMDAAGAFGECCANPDCRACTVLQLIATRADQMGRYPTDQDYYDAVADSMHPADQMEGASRDGH